MACAAWCSGASRDHRPVAEQHRVGRRRQLGKGCGVHAGRCAKPCQHFPVGEALVVRQETAFDQFLQYQAQQRSQVWPGGRLATSFRPIGLRRGRSTTRLVRCPRLRRRGHDDGLAARNSLTTTASASRRESPPRSRAG